MLAWLLILGVEMGVKVEGGTHEHISKIFALDDWRCLSLQELGLGLNLIPVALNHENHCVLLGAHTQNSRS